MTFDEFFFIVLNYNRQNPQQRKGQALVNICRKYRKDILDRYYAQNVWADTSEGVKDPFFKDYLFNPMLNFIESNWK
jgi:hypothetical protein